MSFKLGLVGLCTSHPESWVPIIRELNQEKIVDIEIVAAWDSAEIRPLGFAKQFCGRFNIPACPDNLEDMVNIVDGVIVHTLNWDKHIDQARIFAEAKKSLFIDKPIIGNTKAASQLGVWERNGVRITGGSGLRYAYEIRYFLAQPLYKRGEIHTAYACCGVDEFNYGIHAYALLSGLMGSGVKSVQYLGASGQKHIKVTWHNGTIGFATVGKSVWLPFAAMAITDKTIRPIAIDHNKIYRALLEAMLPYMTFKSDEHHLSVNSLIEPELMAIAARVSWQNSGQEVFLNDLGINDDGYDGTQAANEYKQRV